MAIFHLSAKIISRKAGRSAVGAAAYRSGELLIDERTGEIHDYRRRGGVSNAEIVMPAGSDWKPTRSELWNAVEAKNKRADSQVAREFLVALPDELDAGQRRELAMAFSSELADKYQIAVDVAIHEPGREGDQRNHHAHILMSTNKVQGHGFGNKARELDFVAHNMAGKVGQANEIDLARERWEQLVNQALEKDGQEARIDHRSLQDQGITDRVPTVHLGPAAAGIERRGDVSQITERERQKVAQVIAQAQADAAIQAAAERDVQELEAQLAQVLDDQADPKGHAQRLRREIVEYEAEHMAGPSARLRQASEALNRSQRRELVEPAHRAVSQARMGQQRSRKAVQALTAKIEAVPWYRPMKRRQVAKERSEAEAQLLEMQAVIDKNQPMASRPVKERCLEAVQAAQLELDQVQPGMDALQHELDEVEQGIGQREASRQAEAARAREAIKEAQARQQAKEHQQRIADWKASPGYAKEQQRKLAEIEHKATSEPSNTPGMG